VDRLPHKRRSVAGQGKIEIYNTSLKESEKMIRQAVILAAGRGKRMKENATDETIKKTPKALLEVRELPIIEHKIRELKGYGIDICIVINPNDEKDFRDKLKQYDLTYCYQNEPLGTANALYSAKDFVKDELFLVMMGDDLTEYDTKKLISENTPIVCGLEVNDVSGFGALIVNANGEVEKIIEKEMSGRGFVNTAVYVMPKSFFEYYKEIKPSQKSGEYYLTEAPAVLARHRIIFKLRKLDNWIGINTPSDLLKANGQ
jgi:glucose-1-phosphate thymidylyltransferase